jgi:hypothetical protein
MKKISDDIKVKIKLARESQENYEVFNKQIIEHEDDGEDPFN